MALPGRPPPLPRTAAPFRPEQSLGLRSGRQPGERSGSGRGGGSTLRRPPRLRFSRLGSNPPQEPGLGKVCAVCTPGVSAGSCSHARPGTCWVCVCACVSALWLRALLWAILHLCFHAWFLESEFLEELLGPSAPTWLTARLAPSLSSPGPWQGHGAAPRPSCPPALTAARAGPPELRYSPFSFFGRALLGARAPSLRARCPGCPLQALGSGLGFPLSPAMGPASPLREPRCPVPQPAVPLQLDSAWSKNSMEPP